MGIERIDEHLCTGCRTCVETCPMDVIRFDEKKKKPIIAYPKDCQSCYLCEMYCPEEAIYVTPWRAKPIPAVY